MNAIGIHQDDQVSIIDDNGEIFDGSDSDTEESCTGGGSGPRRFGFMEGLDGVVRVEEESTEHRRIERSFVLGMGKFARETSVVAIHKTNSSLIGRARMESFRIFSQAMGERRGGNANVRFAWYGGWRDEIVSVVNHGFSRCGRTKSGGSGCGGIGVHLSPAMFSIQSALATNVDEDGLRHVLLCRVILGEMEAVPEGSNQIHPSSDQFDSGVDNPSAPRRYIVWSAFMNSHIFPNYIISFRSPFLKGSQRMQPKQSSIMRRPTTPWMSFPILMSILSRCLDSSKMGSITKHYNDFRTRKITRPELIRMVRQLAGDELLARVIKLHINK